MKVTVPHNKTPDEVKQAVDQAVDQLFGGMPIGLIQIADQRKQWEGHMLRFWLTAKMGLIRNPIEGTILVGDRDLTIDVDLGMLNMLLPEQKVRKTIEDSLQGKLLGPGKA